MNSDAKALSSEALSQAIRDKVAEANKLQRHLTEATIRARGVLESLRPTLDEIAAYMHRETGLDVVAERHAPGYLLAPLTDTPTARVAVEFREITVPSEPPTSLLGGFQVRVSMDGDVTILAFWAAGDAREEIALHCWTESIQGTFTTRADTIKRAAEALYSQRHHACEFLLDALSSMIPSS